MVFPKRVILHERHRHDSFLLSNTSSGEMHFDIRFLDRVQEPNGITTETDTYVYSASRVLKYSPRKRLYMPADGSKAIRMMVTKFGTLADGEYKSYLSILGKDSVANSVAVRLNLPVIVRKGKLHASADFGQVTLAEHAVLVELKRQGNRSIFGDITIRQEQKVVGQLKKIAVYRESEKITLRVNLKEGVSAKGNINVEFVEDENSGNIVVTKTVTL